MLQVPQNTFNNHGQLQTKRQISIKVRLCINMYNPYFLSVGLLVPQQSCPAGTGVDRYRQAFTMG
jgi:hypothetical protein